MLRADSHSFKGHIRMTDAPLGSKANPSKFDCYPDLPDDEPYFVIRAHDTLSDALVELQAVDKLEREREAQAAAELAAATAAADEMAQQLIAEEKGE